MRPSRPPTPALALAALLAPLGVHAQSIPGTSPMDLSALQSATLSARIGALSVGVTAGQGSAGRGAGRAAPALAADALGYRRDPAVSRRVRERVAASARGGNAFQRRAMRTGITGGAVYDTYARAMRQYGLEPDDAGDAMTAYMASLWLLANDPARVPTRAELQGVRAQVRRALAANSEAPVVRSEAARQELGETFAHQMALAEMAADPVIKRADQAALRQLADGAAADGRQALGVDLRALALTDRGFQPLGAARADAAAWGASREVADAREPAPEPAATAAARTPRGDARGSTRGAFDAAGIAHVVLRFTVTPMINGGTSTDFNPSVLYRDGRAVDPDDPRPDGRGRWRQEGPRTITAEWESGRKSRWENIGSGSYHYARPGAPAGGLNGTFRTMYVSGIGEVTAFSARALTFRPDGTFALEGSGGGVGPGTAVSARSQAGGRYRVDGWTITFTYPDGRSETGLFYRFPDSDRVLGIGGPGGVRTYTLRRD